MTHTIKQNSDINVWGAVLGDALSRLRLVSDIKIVANGNNPPTVQAGTNFQIYGTDTFTSSPATPTGNNVYPANTSLTYYLDSVIFELADQTFAWNTAASATSAGIPAKSNSTTYYLFCNGGQDVDSTSRGKGKYGVSTNAPTYDAVKKGWYSSDGLVLLMFKTDGSGNVLTTAGNYLILNQLNLGDIDIVDLKSANTAGGTFTSGADRTRDLNTVIYQSIFNASLASNQITLPEGIYYINASAPGWRVANHQSKLYNTTNSTSLLTGTSEYNSTSPTASSRSIINGIFTLSASSVLEIRHRGNTTQNTDGFGYPANLGNNEIYTIVHISKLK